MLNARNTDDTRMFSKMKWLSKLQIQGFFSRVSAKRKQSDDKETSSHDDEPDDSEELAQLFYLVDLLYVLVKYILPYFSQSG